MATFETESLPDNQVKLTITVPIEEMRPYLEAAATRIAEHTEIPGFRPGKADYQTVKRLVGEMKIYEEALEPIVRRTYVEAVLGKKIETVGSPKIDVAKLVPDNDLVYTAEATLMPSVTKLADYNTLSIDAKPVAIEDKAITAALKDIQRMQTKEIRAAAGHTSTKENKVIIDMTIKKDGVPVEGGQGVGHGVYLNEQYYIPNFAESLIGLKEGEEKKFSLPFPEDHYQKHLAGTPVDFEITVREIYHLEFPTIDDEFAKSLGQTDMTSLKALLEKNMREEKEGEEKTCQEKTLLETLADASQFDNIPALLLNEELNKMGEELKHGVTEQGPEFDEYLKKIKKSLPELKLDFTPEALKRIKIALLIRDIAKQEDIHATAEEVDTELDRQAEEYKEEDIKKRVYSPEYREYIETLMRNRHVIEFLHSKMVK